MLEANELLGRTDEIIFNRKVSKWIDLNYVIEKEMKNAFALYYGQCDDKIKATLAMDNNFDTVNNSKNLIGQYKILWRVNFSYTASKEPFVTILKVKLDFMRLHQLNRQVVDKHSER